MIFSLNHLKRFFKNDISNTEISAKLMQLGHENEVKGNLIDLDITPNRGDCLSIKGLAQELNSFYETKDILDIYSNNIDELQLSFTNNAIDDCPKIAFLKIEIEEIPINYKSYLESFFSELGLNKINFFTDISNYVAYELGQPTHCYDFFTIENDFELKNSKQDYEFKALTNKEIKLVDSNLVFMSGGKVINLAGVMGGLSSSCSSETKTALVECAYFKPESIIGKSVKYDFNSEAAYKFERGTDPKNIEFALRRFIKIVEDHTKIRSLKLYIEDHVKDEDKFVNYDLERVNSILGSKIAETDFNSYLKKLGFRIDNKKILIPSFRSDIENNNDIAEELARVIGYNNLPTKPISLKVKARKKTTLEDKVKSFLVEKGFSEVINAPFSELGDSFSIEIDNPLDSSKRFFRKNLTESILTNLLYNERRQKESIKIFEISDIYSLNKRTKDLEKVKKLALIISGREGENYKDFNKFMNESFLKSVFSELYEKFNFEIKNISRENLNTKIKHQIFCIELELESIRELFEGREFSFLPRFKNIKYSQISEFPSIKRDLSFKLEDYSKITNLVNLIESFEHDDLKEVFVFDFYNNAKKEEIKIGYRFVFQSMEKTLTDIEVDNIISDIIKSISDLGDVHVPGYD